jgi:hypothetical protein
LDAAAECVGWGGGAKTIRYQLSSQVCDLKLLAKSLAL